MQSRRIALRRVCGIYFFLSSGSTGDISGGRETVTVFICLRRVNAREVRRVRFGGRESNGRQMYHRSIKYKVMNLKKSEKKGETGNDERSVWRVYRSSAQMRQTG